MSFVSEPAYKAGDTVNATRGGQTRQGRVLAPFTQGGEPFFLVQWPDHTQDVFTTEELERP